VFNHRFDRNIPVLEALYRERFPDIRYLVPFYDGTREDVIPVHHAAIHFQGFFRDALRSLSDARFTHYVFCADDMLLSPHLTAASVLGRLGLGPGQGYIKNLAPLSNIYYLWLELVGFWPAFNARQFDYKLHLPPAPGAAAAIARHGIKLGPLTLANLRHWNGGIRLSDFRKHPQLLRALRFLRRPVPLPYPLVAGYADFMVVPAAALPEFCRLCGVFAAMGLFAEIGAPTALALSCESIVTEMAAGDHWMSGNRKTGLAQHGIELWSEAAEEDLGTRHKWNVQSLLASMAPDVTYIHPVKLSKWNG
jgi:hypothetical protein